MFAFTLTEFTLSLSLLSFITMRACDPFLDLRETEKRPKGRPSRSCVCPRAS